jgi:tRNA 2-thiocytidine biosynthesis protein TtcA
LQQQLPISFQLTVVHIDQKQPSNNGTSLVQWLENDLKVPFQVVEEDTYSIAVEKTPFKNKSYCTACAWSITTSRHFVFDSYRTWLQQDFLGTQADDAMETFLLSMLHAGQLKAMSARYTSQQGSLAVLRPLIQCMESYIARFASSLQGLAFRSCLAIRAAIKPICNGHK